MFSNLDSWPGQPYLYSVFYRSIYASYRLIVVSGFGGIQHTDWYNRTDRCSFNLRFRNNSVLNILAYIHIIIMLCHSCNNKICIRILAKQPHLLLSVPIVLPSKCSGSISILVRMDTLWTHGTRSRHGICETNENNETKYNNIIFVL